MATSTKATSPRFVVRQVAVLGAGVMGAQIAAHFANANVPVLLFDLPASKDPLNSQIEKAIEQLAKMEPAPLASKDRLTYIKPANYQQNLPALQECSLVIEAISERLDWKQALYTQIAPHLGPQTILASNTSGLSLATLAAGLPADMQTRFCGMHFFNPPRYMHLVELIRAPQTDLELLNQLETFLVSQLGKGVIRAKDTPNFIANRIGIFSILATMHHTLAFDLGFDEVDALTGPLIGRAKSATYRTADVVGLDTMAHVIDTMANTLQQDPWHRYFQQPAWLQTLVARGALGQKTKGGIFQKNQGEIQVLDAKTGNYRPSKAQIYPAVAAILKNPDPKIRFEKLRNHNHPQAQFLWACYRDLFHYCAYHLEEIAENARDLDLAIRWGFGWKQGPFEIWQAAGWSDVAAWLEEEITQGKTLGSAKLPEWVGQLEERNTGIYTPAGAYSPEQKTHQARSALPVYQRQRFPDPVLGEHFDSGSTILETEAVRFWNLPSHPEVGILSFKTKLNTISSAVLDGIQQTLDYAEQNLGAFLLWQPKEPFSAGADLAGLQPQFMAKQWSAIEAIVAAFQQTSMRLKYARVPTVAALRGLTLGGGCEFAMHCQQVVAALETYIGLVEVGVGLLPAGGGCKERALRAFQATKLSNGGDSFPFLRQAFETIAMGKVAKSAWEAFELGHLKPGDTVIMNSDELLHVALAKARALAEVQYLSPQPVSLFPVAGKTGIANLKAALVNMREGGYISAYDYEIGGRIAHVLCGGEVEPGSLVDETWMLDLERAEFMALLQNGKTHERIFHMLETGKPLRN